jgi:hypothetical protein
MAATIPTDSSASRERYFVGKTVAGIFVSNHIHVQTAEAARKGRFFSVDEDDKTRRAFELPLREHCTQLI